MPLPSPEERAAGRAPLAFVVFLGLMSSVVAMTIDAVLPALDALAADLAFASANDRQLVVLVVIVGMGLGQPVFGPLSDSIGRRPAAMIGWGLHLAGTLLCLAAETPTAMLAGRFLQGFGAGGPRVIAVAILRDLYAGRAMARILSLVLTIFMIVPMLAPLIGQALEAVAGWRAIFWAYAGVAVLSAGWYLAGLPETHPRAARRPFSPAVLARAFGAVLSNRAAMAYTASAACTFGPFLTYIATAQQILEESYALGPLFPLAFGTLAIAFAGASFLNSRLVMALGMRRLARAGLAVMTATSAAGLAAISAGVVGPLPPLWLFMALMGVVFACVAILFANFQALALEPLGHVAGTASAVVLSLAGLGAAPMAFLIARSYAGSVAPLFAGFTILGLAALALFALAERTRRAPA